MSAPRTKRPFAGAATDPSQRQITSFFSRHAPEHDGSSVSGSASPTPSPSSRPPLPAMVQSNLLSVGMRVRKSVAEGHKIGNTCDFTMWGADSCGSTATTTQKPQHAPAHHSHRATPPPAFAPIAIPADAAASAAQQQQGQQPLDPRSSSYVPLPGTSATRELLPFCGIHNIGGLSAQPYRHDPEQEPPTAQRAIPPAAFAPPGIDDVPGLSSSQESAGSTASLPLAGRKRACPRDNDDDAGDGGNNQPGLWRHRLADCDLIPLSTRPAGYEGARVFAEPRSRRPHDAPAATFTFKGGCGDVAVADNDFPEAEFLDYREYSPDMEMGGV